VLPLYLQLATYLRALIKTLQLQPGECIPSEPDLARRFNVSRATARQAVDVLLTSGMVRRVQGRGTFLTERVVEPPPTLLLGIVEDYLYRGEPLLTTVLSAGAVPAPPRVAAFFGMQRGATVFRVARRRSRSTAAVSYVLSYLRPEDGKRIERTWLAKESLIRILAIRLGIPLGIIQQGVEAAQAGRGIAGRLGVPPSASILKIETRVWTRLGAPVDYVETYLQPGHRYIMEYEWAGIVPTGKGDGGFRQRAGQSRRRG
jgi:GntR family transcriptional regulator